MDRTWTVVRFLEENTVEAVPTSWLIGQNCYWPTYTNEKVVAAIRNQEQPNTCWPTHKVSLYRNGTFDSYIDARRRAKAAEYESSDCSEDKETRKNRKKILLSSSEDDSDSNIPDPPQRMSMNLKSQDKVLPALDIHANIENNNMEITSNNNNQLQEIGSKSDDIILDFECSCCTIHNKKDIQNLSALKEDMRTVFSENFKTLSRKQNIITTIMFDLVNEVRKISEELKNIRNGVSNSAETEEQYASIFKDFKLPIDSVEGMKEFEEFLSTEKNLIASIHEISRIGGSTSYDFAKRVFGRILTNEMTIKYTWLGTKEKDALSKTRLAEVLLRASEKCCPSWDVKQTEEAIKKYLRRARERLTCVNKKSGAISKN